MKVNIRHQVSPYLIFYIIYSSQVGVGILSFQRVIAIKAGFDAWIAVLTAGFIVQLLIWVMYKLLEKADGDILDVHQQVYGRVIGNMFSLIIMVYYGMAGLSVLLGYVDILQVWMFPTLPTWVISTAVLLLVYYCISGGFRVVVGLSFLSFIFPQVYLILLYFFPLKEAHFANLLPVMNHRFMDMMDAMKQSIYTLAGTEVLLMVYPFIRDAKSSKKYAHLAVLFTTLLYTLSAIVSFTFYSEGQLKHVIWPELSLTKIIRLPFLERFEYVYISIYLVIVVSLLALLLWASSRGFKLIFQKKQKYFLIGLSIISIGFSQFATEEWIDILNKAITYMNLGMFYVYLPILLAIITLIKRGKQHG